MDKNNHYINVWGAFFFIFFACEYLFNLGDYSIFVFIGLLALLSLYLIIFNLRKLKYVPYDCILSFLILPFISLLIFIGVDKIGFDYSCSTDFCTNGFRYNYFVALNVIYSVVLVVVNMFMYVARLTFLKKKTSLF